MSSDGDGSSSEEEPGGLMDTTPTFGEPGDRRSAVEPGTSTDVQPGQLVKRSSMKSLTSQGHTDAARIDVSPSNQLAHSRSSLTQASAQRGHSRTSLTQIVTSHGSSRTSMNKAGIPVNASHTSLSKAGTPVNASHTSLSKAGTPVNASHTSLNKAGTSTHISHTSLNKAGTPVNASHTSLNKVGSHVSNSRRSLSKVGTPIGHSRTSISHPVCYPRTSISHCQDSVGSPSSPMDPRKLLSQFSVIKLQPRVDSDGNVAVVHHEHVDTIPSVDSFHKPMQTAVISPINSEPVVIATMPPKQMGRFSVSPAQSIPISGKRHVHGSVTPTHSERSRTVRVESPEMQFKMSGTSLHDGDPEQEALLQNHVLENACENLTEYANGLDETPADGNMADENVMFELGDYGSYMQTVDENQKTVQSFFSVNTQDSLLFEHAPLQCGNIRFVRDTMDILREPKKHYMCVQSDTPLDEVTMFMSRYWQLRNPKIVLSVISASENFKPWKNQRFRDDFQKGILKAANATEMWIVTNGIDAGVPKIIGDAVHEFNIEQLNSHLLVNPVLSKTEQRLKRLTVMGIVPKDSVPYGVYFDGTEGVQVRNMGQKGNTDIFELNPEHTHFILAEEDGREPGCNSLRYQIEKQFRIKSGRRRRHRLMSTGSEQEKVSPLKAGEQENVIPVVGLLVQGSPTDIDHVLFYLQNKMPLIVLKGSGGIADILAYGHEEIVEKGDTDPDYEENVLKPELTKMINRVYSAWFEDNDLAKFALRDKILQCVKITNEGDGDYSYITIVNMKGWASSLRDLDKYILRALFKSEKQDVVNQGDQLQNDLQLTIDWNRPDLAGEIFQQDFSKVRIDKKMFEQSLLQKDREKFIDLFLTQGVKIHKYLNHKKFRLLFEKAADREFFVNMCLEGVLGITLLPTETLPASFLPENLNRLIYKLAAIRNFIQPYEPSMSSTGVYVADSSVAERKAVNSLIVWAVLMNRHKLAKTLWNRCDEPIGVALICSRIFRELAKYTMEQYQRTEMEQNAKEFGQMALGALAICWRDSSVQAYSMLGRRLPDFNNKSVIEIAHDAGYIHFLAHPCCQKWLTKMFFGHLQVKELDWGLFRLPYWFKILVSVFFIFPMYIWITFIPAGKKKTFADGDDESIFSLEDSDSDDEDGEDNVHGSQSTIDNPAIRAAMQHSKKKGGFGSRIRSAIKFRRRPRTVSFPMKIYLLWTAPITKFWMTQMFYFMFLGLFCLATLWPVCGNSYLDIFLWLWTACIEMELVYRVYMKYHKYRTLSLLGNCLDIVVILTFLIILLLTRILHIWVSFTNYVTAKTFMCYGIIYFFYRLLGVYMPISPTLGPMLLRMQRMVKHDFVTFIRMFLIFMVAGGVTIQAVLYPNWPLNWELFKRVVTRPIYAMFLTQVADLDGDPSCSHKYENLTGYCSTSEPNVYRHFREFAGTGRDDLAESLAKCPHPSFSAYLITIQYLLICKLVLVTLLFAMFSLTIGKVDKEASEIWKFQRYSIVTDFIERFSLPPPFTVINFVYLFLKAIWGKLSHFTCRCRRRSKKKLQAKGTKIGRPKNVDDTMFWKRVAREYVTSEEAKAENQNLASKQENILVTLQEDLRSHRKGMKRLNDRVMELERMIQSSRLYLEDIAHKLDKTDVMGITNVKGNFIHVAARQSPYPATNTTRFPVFDKYVPWEVLYEVYDPKTFTLKKEGFPETETGFVDEDLIEIHRMKEERTMMSEEEVAKLPAIPDFEPKWNATATFRVDGERREIDRRSWIDINDQPLRYDVDLLGIPQNPLGRTGMRGKGNLWRWGPNHVIKAVVTRWRRKVGPDPGALSNYLYVEGKRVLEFIAVWKQNYQDSSYCLPGDVLHGLSNPCSILCRSFMACVFDEADNGQYKTFDQSEMIEFFAQFAVNSMGESVSGTSADNTGVIRPSGSIMFSQMSGQAKSNIRIENDQVGFSASLLYKGYLDDSRNTDNAWVEAEVWNFHYDMADNFDTQITEESVVKWKEVSPYVKMFGNETVIVQEAARIHDAYY